MKRATWRKQFLVLGMGWALLAGMGCSVNEKATGACKDSPTMDDCKSCCSKNGASGHSAKYIGDAKECKCLGG